MRVSPGNLWILGSATLAATLIWLGTSSGSRSPTEPKASVAQSAEPPPTASQIRTAAGTREPEAFPTDAHEAAGHPTKTKLRFRVVGPSGRPVHGAAIEIESLTKSQAANYSAPVRELLVERLRHKMSEVAFSDGQGEVEAPSPGTAFVASVDHPNFICLRQAFLHADSSPQVEYALRLEQGGMLRATIQPPASAADRPIDFRYWLVSPTGLHGGVERTGTFDDHGQAIERGIPPGTYQVRVKCTEDFAQRWLGEPVLPATHAWSGWTQSVSIDNATTTAVHLAPEPIAVIQGVVRGSAGPLSGIDVFAAEATASRPDPWPRPLGRFGNWVDIVGRKATTRADGRFHFHVPGPGTWKLTARGTGSPDASPVETVTVHRPGTTHGAHLTVGTATLRCQLDLPKPPRSLSDMVGVELLPPELYGLDPIRFDFEHPDRGWTRKIERPRSGGKPLEFPFLRRGTWVLRVKDGPDAIEHQRVVHVEGDTDLGRMVPTERTVPTELRIRVQGAKVTSSVAVSLHRRLRDGTSAFVCHARFPDDDFEWPTTEAPYYRVTGRSVAQVELEPGQYELQLVDYNSHEHQRSCYSGDSTRFLGATAQARLSPDGKWTPAIQEFTPPKGH